MKLAKMSGSHYELLAWMDLTTKLAKINGSHYEAS